MESLYPIRFYVDIEENGEGGYNYGPFTGKNEEEVFQIAKETACSALKAGKLTDPLTDWSVIVWGYNKKSDVTEIFHKPMDEMVRSSD